MPGINDIVKALMDSANAPSSNPSRLPAGLLRQKAEPAIAALPAPFQNTPESNQAALNAALNFGPSSIMGMVGMATKVPKVHSESAKTLADAFEKYNTMASKEIQTPQDILRVMEELPGLEGIPKGLQSAARKYRKAVDEDFYVYAGRNDVEPYEEAFISALESLRNKVLPK